MLRSTKIEFTVLIIGGSAGTGKTYLAQQLLEYFRVPFLEVDDLRLAMQRATTPETSPDLFTFESQAHRYVEFLRSNDVSNLALKMEDVARAVWLGLKVVIESHLFNNQPVIIEGDGILPCLLSEFRGDSKVRAVFLFDDGKSIATRMMQRSRVLHDNEVDFDLDARLSHANGLRLQVQAREHGYPVIDSSPGSTLLDRVLELV